jgi:hypothetical protein
MLSTSSAALLALGSAIVRVDHSGCVLSVTRVGSVASAGAVFTFSVSMKPVAWARAGDPLFASLSMDARLTR